MSSIFIEHDTFLPGCAGKFVPLGFSSGTSLSPPAAMGRRRVNAGTKGAGVGGASYFTPRRHLLGAGVISGCYQLNG